MSHCYGCMKLGVLFVAFFFLLMGVAVVGLSTYLLLEPAEETYLELTRNDEYLYYGKIFLLVSGCLMFLGGILGCFGGFKQSSACLSLFLAIVLIISVAELAAGVYAYVNRDDFMDYFKNLMGKSLKSQYNRDQVITDAWDLLQREMECCGASNYKDYQQSKADTVDMTLSSVSNNGFYTIPASCCVETSPGSCEDLKIPINGAIPPSVRIYQDGCSEKLIQWMNTQAYYIIAFLIIFGSIQLLCLLFTCILICAFRSRRTYKN